MSKVDVKSYFQDLLCFLGGRDDLAGFEIQQTEDVAAALVELVEAAKEVEKDAEILGMSCSRLNAALANIRSAK